MGRGRWGKDYWRLILTEQVLLLNCPPEIWLRSYTLTKLTGHQWLSERSGQEDTKQSFPRQPRIIVTRRGGKRRMWRDPPQLSANGRPG